FFATWFHLLDDGSGVVADGPHPESGPMAVVGGMGRYNGASGELSDEIIGTEQHWLPESSIDDLSQEGGAEIIRARGRRSLRVLKVPAAPRYNASPFAASLAREVRPHPDNVRSFVIDPDRWQRVEQL